ncbi:MAG TPA: hypothetical protein DCX54_00685 [Flavobacteriales bacterium]|nr:hypothetical protein [Flavobacteriales bacterium]
MHFSTLISTYTPIPLYPIKRGIGESWNRVIIFWTLESGIWNLDSGIWNLESGLWTLESGLWNL